MKIEDSQHARGTLAFLELVASGDEDIAQGNARPVGDFVQEMRDKLAKLKSFGLTSQKLSKNT